MLVDKLFQIPSWKNNISALFQTMEVIVKQINFHWIFLIKALIHLTTAKIDAAHKCCQGLLSYIFFDKSRKSIVDEYKLLEWRTQHYILGFYISVSNFEIVEDRKILVEDIHIKLLASL